MRKISYPLIAALVLASFLLIPALGTVPGLHGDEAWAGSRAHEILQGARPVLGMNDYTGPFHQYLLAPFFKIFGFKVAVLRSITAFNALLAVLLYFQVTSRLFDRKVAEVSTLLLVTLPSFTAYGRVATENFALNPLLALASLSLILRGFERQSRCSWMLSGILIGLGIWNHLIFAGFVPPLIVLGLLHLKRRLFTRHSPLGWVALGTLFVTGSRFLLVGRLVPDSVGSQTLLSVLERSRELALQWPGLLLQIVHGDVLFQRFTGEVLLPTPPLIPVLLGISALHLLFRRTLSWFAFTGALFFSTLVISQGSSDRYFLLVLYCLPIPLALLYCDAARVEGLRRTLPALGLAFLLFQVLRTERCYFQAFQRSHGRTSVFGLGRQLETSNHFIQSEELHSELARAGARTVMAEFFIALPLRFHDLDAHALEQVTELGHQEALEPRHPVFVVVYAGGLRRARPEDFPHLRVVSENAQYLILRPP